MEPKRLYSIRYVLQPKDIMTFVSGLHEIQKDMIEEALEKSDMREAKEIIDYIRVKSIKNQ